MEYLQQRRECHLTEICPVVFTTSTLWIKAVTVKVITGEKTVTHHLPSSDIHPFSNLQFFISIVANLDSSVQWVERAAVSTVEIHINMSMLSGLAPLGLAKPWMSAWGACHSSNGVDCYTSSTRMHDWRVPCSPGSPHSSKQWLRAEPCPIFQQHCCHANRVSGISCGGKAVTETSVR